MKLRLIFILITIVISSIAFSQFSIGVSFSGISYHQGNVNTKPFKWKISKNGKLTGFVSVSLLASYQFNNYIGIKIIQNFAISDCAGKFAGITHIGIDLHDDIIGWESQKSQFSMTFGPFWYYRKNWLQEKEYTHKEGFLKLSKDNIWEHKFIWYGGVIEYSYYFNQHNALTFSLLPAIPYLYTFGIGTKYKY